MCARPPHLLFFIALALTTLSSNGCIGSHPPALSAITVAGVNEQGEPDPVYAARTVFGPPLPVVGVRPGRPPKAGTLLWNEPTRGTIHITLAKGRQSFTFHTTTWGQARRFVVAFFLDGASEPALALETEGEETHDNRLLRPLGLDGELLAARAATRAVRWRGYEVRIEDIALPDTRFPLDMVGPWKLRPDNVADLVGTVVFMVQEVSPASGNNLGPAAKPTP
ncbi:MAG: hypothetical protein N3C12_10450 [Candidatus Binatia bacterium]|nr:hypothetical protein [Candidatus Binatia bacterium]